MDEKIFTVYMHVAPNNKRVENALAFVEAT